MWWTVRLPLGFSADLNPICWFFPAFIWKLLGWKCLIVMLTGIWSQNVSQFGLRCCCIAPLFLCIDHWGRLFYPSLLFFGTLYSNGNIFLFLLCFLLLFFAELFVRPPQTAILLFCISFPWHPLSAVCIGIQFCISKTFTRGHMYTYGWFMLIFGRKQQNSVKQLSFS